MIKEDLYRTAKRHAVLLEMMKDVHAFMEAHGIVYSMGCGSLLGAVRHNGFIPWDDDIDRILDRENYERLLKIFGECEGYVLQRTLWIYRIQREEDRGVKNLTVPTIDLFVLDAIPTSSLKRRYQLLRLRMLQGMMKGEVDYSSYSFVYRCCLRVTHWLGTLVSEDKKFAQYDRVSQMGDPKRATKIGCCNETYHSIGFCYDRDILEKTGLHTFEDTEFRILDRYDHYLQIRYGSDYMTPPPEEERKPIHLQ